jgi:hypothetical protein
MKSGIVNKEYGSHLSIVIACPTVIEELRPLLPPAMEARVLDFGLHVNPESLRKTLQDEINAADGAADIIILGYGLCSNAVVGLNTAHSTLVIPRVDDCIALFLGSTQAYREQTRQTPGTYYLTKGWIEVSDTPFEEHKRLVERYGQERADHVMAVMLKHYTRLAYIDTGQNDQEHYRRHARQTAEQFNLRFEEIPGSLALIQKMVRGSWDDDFIVAPPGHIVTLDDFKLNGS